MYTEAGGINRMDRDGFANFFLGLGVGLGLGLLFAPKSGQETRQMLRDKADEGADYLKKQASELRENADQLVDKGRDALNRQRDSVNEAIAAGRQAYREKVEQSPEPAA
jgi:gas vesicle protein